jgi:type VI secretion system protein ImpA
MPCSFTIDLERLRQPLEGEHPGGINLQIDEEGRRIRSALRDLREEARRIERHADEGDSSEGGWPAAIPIWRRLRDEAIETLTDRSRDTSVAALLIEAVARTDGFAGLAAGFTAAQTMVEAAWNELYPMPDPEDGPADEATLLEERSMPLVRLSGLDTEGLLQPALLRVPLTRDRAGESLGLCHWKSSRDLLGETDSEKIDLAVARGGIAPETFAAAVEATDSDFLTSNYREMQQAAAAWERLCEAVSTVSDGKAVIPVTPLRSFFEECDAAIRSFAPVVTVSAEADAVTEAEPEAAGGPVAAAAGGPAGPPQTREQAFGQLEQIAGFFEKHDPHSLLAAQIRNIVRLGRLPRAAYYQELIADGSAIEALFKFVGIKTAAGNDE